MQLLNRLVLMFTSFHGRIDRKSWWVGFALLVSLSTTIGWLANPPAFDGETIAAAKPPLWLTLLSLVMFVPMLALTVKRLNDRDQPGWVRYIFGALGVSSVFTPYFAPFAEPQKLSTAEWAILAIPALIGLWFFIDNGFLKGTPGPNRYGPDPLDPASGSGTGSPVPIRTRRTRGAWLRDGLVGVLGCIVAAFLLLPGLSIESAARWALKLLEPDILRVSEEMRANEPAWNVFMDGTKAARHEEHEEALVYFSRAIDLYGPDEETAGLVYYHQAFSFRTLGRPNDALQADNMSVQLNPDSADRYTSRARSLRELKRYREALADYDRAIELDTKNGESYMGRGDMLAHLGQTEEAIAAYKNAITATDKDYAYWVEFHEEYSTEPVYKIVERKRKDQRRITAWAHAEIGRILNDRGDRGKALEELNTAIRLRPDYRNAYMTRGWIYEKQGQIDKARADYEKTAELGEPNDWLKRALERVSQN